jgi:N-acetylglutamate synthase-like GNAT family acetyltransferase
MICLIPSETLVEVREYGPWISSLYVAPAFRGRGISLLLVEHCRAKATEAGAEYLYALSSNLRYYARLDWDYGEPINTAAGPAFIFHTRL